MKQQRDPERSKVLIETLRCAREGFAAEGRGFVFLMYSMDSFDSMTTRYCGIGSTEYRDFSDEAKLISLVRDYDPSRSFVVLIAGWNSITERLVIKDIDLWRVQDTGTVISA